VSATGVDVGVVVAGVVVGVVVLGVVIGVVDVVVSGYVVSSAGQSSSATHIPELVRYGADEGQAQPDTQMSKHSS